MLAAMGSSSRTSVPPLKRADSLDPLSSTFTSAASTTPAKVVTPSLVLTIAETVNAQFVGSIMQLVQVKGEISVTSRYVAPPTARSARDDVRARLTCASRHVGVDPLRRCWPPPSAAMRSALSELATPTFEVRLTNAPSQVRGVQLCRTITGTAVQGRPVG